MYLCYMDESGTADIPGNTSHFVLVGVSIPIWHWRDADRDIRTVKARYGLQDTEIHTAWLLRKYLEQSRIDDFQNLSWKQRRSEVAKYRRSYLLQLQHANQIKTYKQAKKTYQHTLPYIHLTLQDRQEFVAQIADCVSEWGFARLFAECIDKVHFDPERTPRSLNEQAFEQVISRFEQYLQNIGDTNDQKSFGLLVHDNNQTIARKHTQLMRNFHREGTLWVNIDRIIETPLFVDSQLTSMIQIADLCSYALRRFLENAEISLFNKIYARADRYLGRAVGVRHFTDQPCPCDICKNH